VVGGLIFSQVITLFITPVIYLFLDKYSGSGPMTDAELAAHESPAAAPTHLLTTIKSASL